MNNKIDLISLEITWNSLKSIADESYITLMKSAFSTNIKERHDHSTAITNSDGKKVPVKLIAERHIREDLGFIPSMIDWFKWIQPQKFMMKGGYLKIDTF